MDCCGDLFFLIDRMETVYLASPRSPILTSPEKSRNTFFGFRSRCTIPFECIYARPSTSCLNKFHNLLQKSERKSSTRITHVVFDRLAGKGIQDISLPVWRRREGAFLYDIAQSLLAILHLYIQSLKGPPQLSLPPAHKRGKHHDDFLPRARL